MRYKAFCEDNEDTPIIVDSDSDESALAFLRRSDYKVIKLVNEATDKIVFAKAPV